MIMTASHAPAASAPSELSLPRIPVRDIVREQVSRIRRVLRLPSHDEHTHLADCSFNDDAKNALPVVPPSAVNNAVPLAAGFEGPRPTRRPSSSQPAAAGAWRPRSRSGSLESVTETDAAEDDLDAEIEAPRLASPSTSPSSSRSTSPSSAGSRGPRSRMNSMEPSEGEAPVAVAASSSRRASLSRPNMHRPRARPQRAVDFIDMIWQAIQGSSRRASLNSASSHATSNPNSRAAAAGAVALNVLRSLAAAGGLGRDQAPSSGEESADYAGYEAFHLSLHRCLMSPGGPWSLLEGRALSRRNFAADSNGSGRMGKRAFAAALSLVARNWSENLLDASPELGTAMALLATEAAAGDGNIPTLFLACLAEVIVRPADAEHPYPIIRPWTEVETGACLTSGVLAILYARAYGHKAELGSKLAPAGPAGPGPAHGHARCQGRDAAVRVDKAEACGSDPEASCALRRRALHNRMDQLLRLKRASISQPEPSNSGSAAWEMGPDLHGLSQL
eukprot:tig00000158_g10166.t1